MGVSRLRGIAASFIGHGAAADTPVALSRWATTGAQRTIVGTLADIALSYYTTNLVPAMATGRVPQNPA